MKKFLFLILLTPFWVFAQDALEYSNAPIDSLCFFEHENNEANLLTCGIKSEKDRKKTGTNTDFLKQGYIGYDYQWPLNLPSDNTSNAFSYYKIIGKFNNVYVVYTINNTGGTGQFSSVLWVERQGDKLIIHPIEGGDRCNGGVSEPYIKDKALLFKVNVTPADYLAFSDNIKNLKAYDDLAACAICCQGEVTYKLDVNKLHMHPLFVSLDLGAETVKPNHDVQGKYQYCFDTLIASYQQKGKRILNLKEIQQLMQEFNRVCVDRQDALT